MKQFLCLENLQSKILLTSGIKNIDFLIIILETDEYIILPWKFYVMLIYFVSIK